MFEAHPDGTIRPLLNCDAEGQSDQETQMGRLSEFNFPSEMHFQLDQTTGLEAFVLVASRRPLPRYSEWKPTAQLDSIWQSLPQQAGVWRSKPDSIKIDNVPVEEDEQPRGHFSTTTPKPLSQLAERTRLTFGNRISLAAFAFPVRGR